MTSVSNILDNIDKVNGIDVNKLEKLLKLTKKNDKLKLEVALKALNKLEVIKYIDNENLILNNEDNHIKGKVRCSSKGYCFVVREDHGEDIYIREGNLNHAWHGDTVIVKINKEGQKRRAPEGSILCILNRHNDILLAKIELDKQNSVLKAYPLDDRIPVIIDIQNNNNDDKIPTKDYIYEIRIEKYPLAQYCAVGSITRELPLNAGTNGDIEILLSKNNIQQNHNSPRISPKKIPSKGRIDFTEQPSLIFKSWQSINSPSLPALFAQPFDGGTRIWIHSPTVAERINIGGKVDDYLKAKGEAICLGNKWLDYLSESLKKVSEFKPNEVCEALTLMLDISSNGEITDWNFSLSQIKPKYLITPKHLECINKRKVTSKSTPIAIKPIKESIEVIYTILHTSRLLNQCSNGSIKLDQEIPNLERLSEMQLAFPSRDYYGWTKSFDIDDPQSVLDIFIRLSNNILAKHLIGYNLPFIFKQHEEVEQGQLNELSKSAISIDKDISINIDGTATMDELIKSFEASSEKKILQKLAKHIIPGIHLKINTSNFNEEIKKELPHVDQEKIESPWCCPSFNYWNIFNQFILSSLLIDGKNKLTSRSKTSIELGRMNSWNQIKWDLFTLKVRETIQKYTDEKLIIYLNDIRNKSKLFRNNIISIAQGREAQKIIGKEVVAVITGVQSYGFFAEITELNAEGLVHVSTLGDDWYEYRSRQNLLVGRKNKKTYQLAQQIKVKVLKVDILKNQIDLVLVDLENDESNILNSNEVTIDS